MSIKDKLIKCLNHLDEMEDWERELKLINERYISNPDYEQLLTEQDRTHDISQINQTLQTLLYLLGKVELKAKNEVDIKTWALKEDKLWRDILKRKGLIKDPFSI